MEPKTPSRRELLALTGGALLTVDAIRAARAQSTELVWPNKQSRANSDPWLRLHHTEVTKMRPRVLVLNFVNGLAEEAAKRKAEALALAIRESSRYHGSSDASAPPFLEYQIFKVVNLTDEAELPDEMRMEGNSSLYPRIPDKNEIPNFRYEALYSEEFTEKYGVEKPGGGKASLTDMVEVGMVHEVWLIANQGAFGGPFGCVEVKQAYSEEGRPIARKSVQAGTGAATDLPFTGKSLRVLFLNAERNVGCALENLSRALETLSASKAVPYFTRYFEEYAGFDLKARFRLPFASLYGRNGMEMDYPEPGKIRYVAKGETRTLEYTPAGGNVSFPPNARRDGDTENRQPVLSTIEHFRLRDGEGGKDKAERWTPERFQKYRDLAPDCMGPWLVYWRQNMPGFNNKAVDDAGRPMKNWWPFLFY